MPDPEFQFFQIVKIDGRCTLEKVPASVFGTTTFMFVWFGQTDIVSVDPAAFTGRVTRRDVCVAGSGCLSVEEFLSLALCVSVSVSIGADSCC